MALAINQMESDKILFSNIEEVLELANVNVFSNFSNLVYAIKITLTDSILYENMIVKPVIKNVFVTNLNFNTKYTNRSK